MEKLNAPPVEILEHAVTEIEEPILFQRLLQDTTGAYTWKLFEWSLPELAKEFGDVKLPFRVGYNSSSMVSYRSPFVHVAFDIYLKHYCNEF